MLGANGAGKTTLIKVLSGVNSDYGGSVIIDGLPIHIDHPTTARAQGIQAVHQKIADGVVPGLSVAENLLFESIVNNKVSRAASLRQLMPEARRMAAVLDLGWSDEMLRSDVHELPIADQQLLLLCRALIVKPRLFVLDEPTSALSETEADRLFEVVRRLRDDGVAIFYVSHRLAEIDGIADRLLVLRDGADPQRSGAAIRLDISPPRHARHRRNRTAGASTRAARSPRRHSCSRMCSSFRSRIRSTCRSVPGR